MRINIENDQLQPFQKIRHYVIDKFIAKGNFFSVYKTLDTKNGKYVALKTTDKVKRKTFLFFFLCI